MPKDGETVKHKSSDPGRDLSPGTPTTEVDPARYQHLSGRKGWQRPAKVVKERLTVHLPVDLIDRIKNAVFWTPGMTLAAFAEEVFSEALIKLEKTRGGPYPARTKALTGGRPMK